MTLPNGKLTLAGALSIAIARSPELEMFSLDMRMAEARQLQAGLLPNPELGFEVENLGGTGDFGGLKAAEATLSLSQLFELGGKRARRGEVASLETDLAGWDYQSTRQVVAAGVARAFISVVAAQHRAVLAEDQLTLAEGSHRVVAEMARAGKVSPVEEVKAKIEVGTATVGRDKAARALELARTMLASTWGSTQADFGEAEGAFAQRERLPSLTSLLTSGEENPMLARWGSEVELRRARLREQRALAIPDLTLGGGLRHFNESDDRAMVLGLTFALPVFDRNQGSIAEAKHGIARAEAEQRSATQEIRKLIVEDFQKLASADAVASALTGEVLRSAQSVFDSVETGYRQGKTSYLEVLDARRTLFEVRSESLDALEDYHAARVELELLTGKSVPPAPVDTSNEEIPAAPAVGNGESK